ncbi:hypothetical protein DXG01_005348 [Tephrocybe rancida]|nr:hypothetical protein DXG01_005348 [Tephrocybe rancida]
MASGDQTSSYLVCSVYFEGEADADDSIRRETDNIPPDSQLTNPNGMVVLGHLGATGGLNLDLDHPLAQNFKLRVGKVEITVPSVPPRDDYIIVLFGDSGNSSPAFAITRITNSTSSTTKSSTRSTTGVRSSSAASAVSTLITEPIPITGTTITGGSTTTSNDLSTTANPTTTSPTTTLVSPSSTQTTPTSSVPASSSTAAGAATTSNSAWTSHSSSTLASLGAASLLLTLLV